jgi:hypothetical protein
VRAVLAWRGCLCGAGCLGDEGGGLGGDVAHLGDEGAHSAARARRADSTARMRQESDLQGREAPRVSKPVPSPIGLRIQSQLRMERREPQRKEWGSDPQGPCGLGGFRNRCRRPTLGLPFQGNSDSYRADGERIERPHGSSPWPLLSKQAPYPSGSHPERFPGGHRKAQRRADYSKAMPCGTHPLATEPGAPVRFTLPELQPS